jgi:predicted esterase
MPAWYDITSLGKDRLAQQAEGLEASRARVAGVIAAEVARGVPASKVVLAGFSQGGAMSLYTGLNLGHALGGILCMSGYLVYPPGVQPGPAAKATPVLMLHGEDDPLVLPSYGRDSAAKLRELGVADVSLRMYADLPHSASPEELADALAFLKARLA